MFSMFSRVNRIARGNVNQIVKRLERPIPVLKEAQKESAQFNQI